MYVIKYIGKIGFIKPISARRDEEIMTQQFLNHSTIAGIERKLFPELLNEQYEQTKIVRHRITFDQLIKDMEQVQTRLPNKVKGMRGWYKKDTVICNRHVMLNPILHLAFHLKEYAERAFEQTLCLCRNEDLMFPVTIEEMTNDEFNDLSGCEMLYPPLANENRLSPSGYNRYNGIFEYGEIIFSNKSKSVELCF